MCVRMNAKIGYENNGNGVLLKQMSQKPFQRSPIDRKMNKKFLHTTT